MSEDQTRDIFRDETYHQRWTWKKVVLSIGVITSVAFTWALATQFSQWALRINPNKFYAPYNMMWFNTNFMTLCYPVFIIYELVLKKNIRQSHERAMSIFGPRGLHPLSLMLYIFPFIILWVAANYTYSISLVKISASVATSVSSCNAAIVYLLSILLLRDKFIPMKLLAVLFAVSGVVLISQDANMNAAWDGIILSVCSATSSAFYKVLFKRLLGNADLAQVSLFMTCIGFVNLLLNWVPGTILMLTGKEYIKWMFIPWLPIIGAALLSLLFNFLVNFGIAILHPLVISVGMLMGIPLSTAIDILIHHIPASGFFLGGTSLIIISFILIIFPYEIICHSRSVRAEEECINSPIKENDINYRTSFTKTIDT